jgi:release factor glutamine methyltransferase
MNYNEITNKLRGAGIENPAFETRIIMEDIAEISSVDFVTKNIIFEDSIHPNPNLPPSRGKEHSRKSSPHSYLGRGEDLGGGDVIIIPFEISQKILSIINRRIKGESLGRILGYRDFWKSRFYLSPETLEPRPDTETLIETALDGEPPRRILDLGTGTGCILLSLLQEFPNATGIGVDISDGACATARGNAERLGLSHRAQFLTGSWIDPLPSDSQFDLIVSNPPYIPSAEIRNLQKEVQNHDPILSLDGGTDGLLPYKYLCSNLKKYLETDGVVLFEFGAGQGNDIIRIVKDAGATLIRVVSDLGGHQRVIKFTYGDN